MQIKVFHAGLQNPMPSSNWCKILECRGSTYGETRHFRTLENFDLQRGLQNLRHRTFSISCESVL